jgi:hypothetical protein
MTKSNKLSLPVLLTITLSSTPTASEPTQVHREEKEVAAATQQTDQPVIKEASVKPGSTVLLLGDSLAVGMSREFEHKSRTAGYIPVTTAVVGTTTFQWIRKIDDVLVTYRPSLVVVSLGTNDAVTYESIARNPDVYEAFVRRARAQGAVVVWVGPPAISEQRIRHIEDTKKIIRNSVPIYYDSSSLDIVLTDGIHTTSKGYEKWMDEVWNWMIDRSIIGPK